VFWRPECINLRLINEDDQFVAMEVHYDGHDKWLFVAVYANPCEV